MKQDSLSTYYTAVAPDYERRYAAPALKAELDSLHETLATLCEDRTVLELGCGTGYWTATLAYVARQVTAIDNCPAMLALAAPRELDPAVVQLQHGDAWDPPAGPFEVVLATGWWPHVPRQQQDAWLRMLRSRMGADTWLILLDELEVEEKTLPVARTDAEGNTFRILPDGNGGRHEILLNYQSDSALRKRFSSHARELKIRRSAHFMVLVCRLK